MKRSPLITPQIPVPVEKLIPGGQGLGTLKSGVHSGQKAFFWCALPGELVTEYQILKHKSNYLEAIATRVENTSEHRTKPKDLHYLATSPWQIMDFDYENQWKKDLLAEALRQEHIVPETPISSTITDGKAYFYRNKMEYSLYFDHEKQQIFPAFHTRGAHRKIPISSSHLEKPEIFSKATAIIADLNARREEARKYQSLILRANAKAEVSGGLLENNRPHPVFDLLTDDILGHTYSYSPNGFFQINLPVYELTLKEIAQNISTSHILDLYSGVGTIGLSVARDKNLTLVESNQSAYQELVKNCTGTSANPVLARSEDALDFIQHNQTVIVDPPRAGLDETVISRLLEKNPERIIYLSCNPSTQARDLRPLIDAYNVKSITPYNFFPRTPHCESLVILDRRNK